MIPITVERFIFVNKKNVSLLMIMVFSGIFNSKTKESESIGLYIILKALFSS
tara:strand:- start:1844 stop:1999 length:156 start_codon:yes stop_codon:yes gene_type:complete